MNKFLIIMSNLATAPGIVSIVMRWPVLGALGARCAAYAYIRSNM